MLNKRAVYRLFLIFCFFLIKQKEEIQKSLESMIALII